MNGDGSVNVVIHSQALPHLKPNLPNAPGLDTDLPLQQFPIPEIILGGVTKELASRARVALVEGAYFLGKITICIESKESTSQLRPIQEIQVGDWFESFNFSTHRAGCRKIEQIFQSTMN